MTGRLVIGGFLTKRVLLTIVLVGVAGVAAYATASIFLVQHNFPAGPKPAVPAVLISSSCSNLVQVVSGPGVFTNASGTFVENGTAVGILYACNATGSPYSPAFTVVQETPVNAPAYTKTTSLSTGTLYAIPDGTPHCGPTTVGIPISDGNPTTLGSGDYDYCLVINNYTGQIQPFTVTWSSSPPVPAHLLIFMTAVIVENSSTGHGFTVTNIAFLNQSTLPTFSSTRGPDLNGVKYSNYKGSADNVTIEAHTGDTITFYIYSKSGPSPPQFSGIPGHGFEILSPQGSPVVSSKTLAFGQWVAVTATFTASGTYLYYCTIVCSPLHPQMFGQILVS